MQDMFRKLREERADGDRGFTMIELLVVVVIIGVLVAIAIPLYMNYRKGADNKSAASDVRGAIAAVEQFYTENSNNYPDTQLPGAAGANVTLGNTTTAPQPATPQTITLSPNNTLSYSRAAAGTSYVLCGTNANGGGVIYSYNSANGGSVKKTAAANTTLALCIAAGG